VRPCFSAFFHALLLSKPVFGLDDLVGFIAFPFLSKRQAYRI
jgi:hypothetical protein